MKYGNLLVKQYRYEVANPDSYNRAYAKAKSFIANQEPTGDPQ